MITLGMDTAGRYLNLALIKEEKTIDTVHRECFKHQSEEILPELQNLLARNGFTPEDVEAIVITEGPGSYTGIRIAMTLAKVFARMKEIPLYTVGSLQFLAGMAKEAIVYMDARAHRGYFGYYRYGKRVTEDTIMKEEELAGFCAAHPDAQIRGDLKPIGKEDLQEDTPYHFADLRSEWRLADPVDPLVPVYLKDSSEYLVKK
ncbi:MAG: tRNA (adenosine(37)-N6)-threonylcarbamoyltransferase complex dimerization subunit type 1 TsaB [Erysipelotrichales bacterium]|nr:tRNA (adenosine(37)-N6)-threonylcarbamoyltransferase complex dimerization subunit type 1 TsaB [Erysipelotrichales bacterium]